MSKIDELKQLADRFACTWCYDWKSHYKLLHGEAIYLKEVADTDCFEVRTSVWALDLKKGELELTEEIHRLTEDDLRSKEHPMGVQDDSPGEFVDVDQWRLPSLFTEEGSKLDDVPEEILSKAVELYCESKDCLGDYFWENDDHFAFSLPEGLNDTVHRVLDRLCRAESTKLREKDAEYQRKIRLFDLIVDTIPPFKVKAGQKVEALKAIGRGVALLNGIPSDYSSSSQGRASTFKKWIESMRNAGHLVASVKGVFAGKEVDGVLAVAVFDISPQETAMAVQSTAIGKGLFIGEDRIPQFIST